MELAELGIDTLRPRFVAETPLPVNEVKFRDEMVRMGWTPRVGSHITDDENELLRHTITYSYQADKDTLRFFILNSGRDIIAEYSAPRLIHNSPLNLQLASPSEAWETVQTVAARFYRQIPVSVNLELARFQRIDVAADVFTEEYRSGMISAGARFKIPKARRQEVAIYPNETAMVMSPAATFRVYNKGLESASKLDDPRLTPAEKAEVIRARDNGRIRLEYVFRERKGYQQKLKSLEFSVLNFVDVLDKGFGSKVIHIGGLPQIRKQIDALDVHEMTRASLYMFVVRYLALGSRGIKEAMSKTAYHAIIRKVREYGLHIDEMSTFEGAIDLNPLFEQLYEHPTYRHVLREFGENRPRSLVLN